MSIDLTAAAEAWLAERHARGYLMRDQRWLIAGFLHGLVLQGINKITTADALAYAYQPRTSTQRWQAARLRAVAGLAAYVHDVDPEAAELIPPGLIRSRTTRRLPYLYSAEQVSRLMVAATTVLTPQLFGLSVRTLIGLLAVTGMRSGEAFALNVEDLDADQALLMVTGKYDHQRLIPLHPTSLAALRTYQAQRPHKVAKPGRPLLFGPQGGRLNQDKARAAFARLVRECQLPDRAGCGSPRPHDLRHSFAVNTLIDAHHQGANVDARLATLATFLGQAQPANTYWYLTASPELMAVVARRAAGPERRALP